jgi:hypothetical protein
MPTGACGVNCDVCRLHIMGVCSTCGSPQSEAGKAKLDAQKNLMGRECPVLGCASEKGVHHCTRDCDDFPCNTFRTGGYPYSESFLSMQERRRKDIHDFPETAETGATPEFWARLVKMDSGLVSSCSGALYDKDGIYTIRSLGETWKVDLNGRKIYKAEGEFGGEWDRQFPFMLLIYLTTASWEELSGEIIAPRELVRGSDFFQGIYRLDTGELEKEFGSRGRSFMDIAYHLGGVPSDRADYGASFELMPKFRVEYLLWEEDDEFPARFCILMDRNTIKHFPPDAAALTLNLFTGRLVYESQKMK